jgi:hypothetical protein
MDCHNSSYQHIFAECLLNLGDYKKARDYFFQAATELDMPSSESSAYVARWVSQQCQKFDTETNIDDQDMLVQYYVSVMRLFESHRQHAFAIEFAFAALGAIATVENLSKQQTVRGMESGDLLWLEIYLVFNF